MRLALIGLAALVLPTPPHSVYTTLDPDACTLVEANPDEGWSTQRCPGTAGYHLLVQEGDLRQSVDVVAPDGSVFPLDYWSVITPSFSALGPRAEWRVEGTGRQARPVALIVRVNAQTGEDPYRSTSYLAVARVSASGACVTDRIVPSADANVRARHAADRAASRPCLTSP